MSARKNIDKLYQHKFEAAEIAPPEDVWQNISARLPEKSQRRKIVPLWLRLAGAAAILLLIVNLGLNYFSTASSTQFVTTPVSRQDIHKEIRLASAEFMETMLLVSMSLQEIMQQEESSRVSPGKKAAGAKTTSLAFAEDGVSRKVLEGEVVAEFNNAGSGLPAVNGSLGKGKSGNIFSEIHTGTDLNSVVGAEGETQLSGQREFSEVEVSEDNAIAQQVAAELAETNKEPEERTGGKMSISTRVAPVFYENMGNGNSMGAGMVGDGTSGEVSLSYGINLAYQVSDRIKIRSGFNKLDLSFSTPGVPMATAMNSEPLLGKFDSSLMAQPVEGDLQQQMDFIEVPIEVEYRLLDSRIGLNLIAGGSTLFLNSNDLSMHTGVRTTSLGQADNMKEVNFSANMGLGMDYQLTPNFRLSLEPMFKYQLNSLGEDVGVRPYYMAIYSGFSFSF